MSNILTPEQYDELRTELTEGRAEIVVTRNFSRQFFTHVGNRSVRDLTGHSVVSKKAAVFCLLILSILLVAACFGYIVRDFAWASVFGVPLTGIAWTVLAGMTTEKGSILLSSALLVPTLVLSYFLPESYQIPLALFAISVFLYRACHIIAQVFLIQLLSTSYDAFDMLSEHFEIVRDAD